MKCFNVNPFKIVFIFLLALASLGCGLLRGGSSNVQLAITGLPANLKQKSVTYQAASGPGPLLATAPAAVQSIALTVSGLNMETLSYYYVTVPDSITLEVPAGAAREFNLYVYLDTGPANPTAVINYLGTATTDLAPDESVTLTLRMIANETKLVVPDFLGSRLVIMNNMRGDDWVNKTAADFGIPDGTFNPHDVDFDAAGYMYVTNFPLGGNNVQVPFIMKINDINTNARSALVSGYTTARSVTSLAIDRNRNCLYYLENQSFQVRDLETNNPATPTSPPLMSTDTVAVDKTSMVYLSGVDMSSNLVINKYSITTNFSSQFYSYTLIASRSLPFAPADILVKDDYLLLLNPEPEPGISKVYKLDTGLNDALIPYGNDALTDTYDSRKGYFYHPVRFLCTTNRKIYLIDDAWDYTYDEEDRIITFDNPVDWFGWKALRGSEAGQSSFRFYQEWIN